MSVYKLPYTAEELVKAVANALNPDTTLKMSGRLADSKITGDKIRDKADALYFDKDTSTLYLMSEGQMLGDGVKVAAAGSGGGGGGGGSSNNAVMTLKNENGWLYKNISQNASCELSMNWSSLEDDVSTGPGVMTIRVGNTVRHSASVKQGNITVDVGPYLTAGSNSVRVTVSDAYGNTRTLAFTINAIALILTSSFDSAAAYTGDITFPFTPTGAVEKTVYFVLDGKEIGQFTTKESGRQQSFTIPAQKHGSHKLRVYFTATIDGEEVPSNTLHYDIICLENGVTKPIISSTFDKESAEQFVPVAVEYYVYDPIGLTASVALIANGVEQSSLTVDRTKQTWSYRPDESGKLALTIKCTGASGEVTEKKFTINVAESSIGATATTNDLDLFLSAYGRNNNEDNPAVWENNGISAELTGFNFKSDGWQLDEDNNAVLRVAGDARVTIPLQIFAQDFRTTGKTIEIEFASRDVLNYDAVMISCMSGGRGLEITTQRATMTSEQSSIGTQYKEEEHVRLSFVVEKKSGNKMLLCYINGILSGVVNYPEDDDFSQQEPVGISIGSNGCTTDIYCIRVYSNDLTRYQILDNWIADTQVGSERRARYERNYVYDDYGAITPGTLKKDLPYLILSAPVLPQFKGDKKTCSGEYVDPVNPENSFTFEDAEIDVQGTSSQYYYVKNYKIKFKGGFILYDGSKVEVYYLNDECVATDTYTFKADVASSEGANNVVLARLYNDLCPVKTAPQKTNPKVRQTIDGHPIVIFWNNGAETKFIGKYNFNHDKGTEEVFGFQPGDESWEILENGNDLVGWHSADYSGDAWKTSFEARYPDKNTDITKLQQLARWLVTTDTTQATGGAIQAVTYGGVTYRYDTAEYRLAKFKAELAGLANVDAMIFYYVFTDLFLCIDQREKNAFPTLFAKDPLWLMLFYDADSSLGTDNKGNLAFDYYLEDIDYTEAGDPIFNGQGSVLWVNLRNAFYADIEAEYKRLRTTIRSDGSGKPLLSYDVVDGMFESHQGKWSEAIYNEDGYRKSIEPFVNAGESIYLPMLQGKKEQHRKWWLYNRFRYKDSQFNTGSSMEKRITIRAHAQANIKLISYVNMYGHVYYNAEMAEHRMFRGQEYEFVWAATGAEDAVIGINDADMLTSLGDLSPLMVELIDISKATHLTALKVGDASASYVNNNLNSITLGNNVLLRTIDLRNCVSLTQAVNASGCTGLEEAYFDGTSITSFTVPNGGNLKKLHLPSTITNLTLLNQSALTEFVMPSYENVTTLRVENSPAIPALDILSQMPANSRVRIIGFDIEAQSANDIGIFYDRLDTMRGLDESGNNMDKPQVSGTIYIGAISQSNLTALQSRYPTVTIAYGAIISVTRELVKRTITSYESDTLTKVGKGAFTRCMALARVSIPSVTLIDQSGFGDCPALTDVYAPNVKTINSGAFVANIQLKAIDLPALTSDIRESTFMRCSSLAYFKVYNALTAYTPFRYCTALRKVEAMNNFNITYARSFADGGLETLILRGSKVSTISSDNEFENTPIAAGTGYIYVPRALVDSYKAATNWASFADQIRAIEDYPEICGGAS